MSINLLKSLGADTSDCVQILYDVAVNMPSYRILELGVRLGVSTVALLLAAKKVNGHLWSIDVDPCVRAVKTVKDNGLDSYWTFMIGDDKTLLLGFTENSMDMVFIDTSHQYEHTLQELRLCDRILRKGGVMLLHDTVGRDYPDVMKAVSVFLREQQEKYVFKELGSRYGLGMLTKKE